MNEYFLNWSPKKTSECLTDEVWWGCPSYLLIKLVPHEKTNYLNWKSVTTSQIVSKLSFDCTQTNRQHLSSPPSSNTLFSRQQKEEKKVVQLNPARRHTLQIQKGVNRTTASLLFPQSVSLVEDVQRGRPYMTPRKFRQCLTPTPPIVTFFFTEALGLSSQNP